MFALPQRGPVALSAANSDILRGLNLPNPSSRVVKMGVGIFYTAGAYADGHRMESAALARSRRNNSSGVENISMPLRVSTGGRRDVSLPRRFGSWP